MTDVYHLIGLGGIGMSALARILMQGGKKVQGSDRTSSALLEQLRNEGALVKIGHDATLVDNATTVIYSSGIDDKNEELQKAIKLRLPILHRSDLLDRLMQGKQNFLVTGTHGKTTTSSLLAWTLITAKLDPSFALGGILSKIDTNGHLGKGPFFVAEADESDGSFLKTAAFGAIVTNLGNDHMNYWKTQEKLVAAFRQFCFSVKNRDLLFWCQDDVRLKAMRPQGLSYGFSSASDIRISGVEQHDKGIRFDLFFKENFYKHIELALFGRHNALNSAAVFGLAVQLGIAEEVIRRAFDSFPGVKRRLEFKGEAHKVKFFDDYGHHPVEIAATLNALRGVAKERRLVAIFQPHRYTRVHDLMEEFLSCFHCADIVILTDIYSAGEMPIEGMTTAVLFARMQAVLKEKLIYMPMPSLEESVADMLKPLDVVLTIGAGDVTLAGGSILSQWAKRAPKVRVALLFGGASAEHEVSISSALTISQALDRSLYDVNYFGITKQGRWSYGCDAFEKMRLQEVENGTKFSSVVLEELMKCEVCIPVLHGPHGEDGMIQGLLETLQIPYVGCDYRSSAVCMHKGWTKRLALVHHIPTAPFFEMEIHEYRNHRELFFEKIEAELGYPVWIKPVHLGSSIGVGCAQTLMEAQACAEYAFSCDDCVIVERHVEGRQIEFGVIGNEYIRVGPPCEILSDGAFVGYEKKYGPSAMPYAIPARLSEIESEIGIDLAKKTYAALGCRGLARVDFFIDQEGYFWLNEINPFPGCTDTSAFPKIWAAAKKSMSQVLDEVLACALQRARK